MTTNEVLLYFNGENDLRLVVAERDELLDLIKLRFPRFCPTTLLKVFGIPKDSLKEYRCPNTKRTSNKYAFNNEPEAKYRLRDEEPPT